MNKKTMKEEFEGYNLYNNETYNNIWQNSTIVLDTNILLNLFKYSEETRNNLLNVLNSLKGRLWIPYQVIKEYYKNRDKVIKDSTIIIDNLNNSIEKKIVEVLDDIKSTSKQIQSIENLEKYFQNIQINYKKEISKIKKVKKLSNEENAKIELAILDLIEDRYETAYEYNSIEEVIKEGDNRIKNGLPPGYKDHNKEEKYKEYQINGDYLIFNSFINYAKENKKDLIFITDDTKEDWFQIVNGEKIGGRRELLSEFYKKTGQFLLIYSSEGFINKYNKDNPDSRISAKSVKEIETFNIKNEWISMLEKGNHDIDNDKRFFFFYNNELSDSEKLICIKKISKRLNVFINNVDFSTDILNTQKIHLNEIIDLIMKIKNYKIERYDKKFKKIDTIISKILYYYSKEYYNSVIIQITFLTNELESLIKDT